MELQLVIVVLDPALINIIEREKRCIKRKRYEKERQKDERKRGRDEEIWDRTIKW